MLFRQSNNSLSKRPLYTIAEITAMTKGSLSRQSVRRLLDSAGVVYIRTGRSIYVPLCELEDKLPKFAKSLISSNELENADDADEFIL